jgi:hypothetical protein
MLGRNTTAVIVAEGGLAHSLVPCSPFNAFIDLCPCKGAQTVQLGEREICEKTTTNKQVLCTRTLRPILY